MSFKRKKKRNDKRKQQTKSREERLRKRTEAQRKRREALRNDSEKYEKAKQKERERFAARIKSGKIKTKNMMTNKEIEIIKRRNCQAARRYRERKKFENIACADVSDENPNSIISNTQEEEKSSRGRKRMRKKVDSKLFRVNLQLKDENTKLKRKLKTAKEKMSRIKKSINAEPVDDITKEVNEVIGKEKVSEKIRKKLKEGVILKHNIVTAYKDARAHKAKENIRSILNRNTRGSKNEYQVRNVINYKITRKNNNLRQCKKTSLRILIQQFYIENSRIRPGKREYITKKKIQKQSAYLNAPIRSLFEKFRSEHKSVKLSYSYFAKARPFWIIPPKVNARDTCLCVTHENIILLSKSLVINNIVAQKNIYKIIDSIVCEPRTENCMLRKCSKCKNKTVKINTEKDRNEELSYKKWVTKKENRISAKTKKEISVQLTVKETIVTTVADIEENFQSDLLIPFMAHLQRIIHQSKIAKDIKETLSECDLYILMDWSENYLCKYAQEPQSVHFGASRQQVSLHTGMIYSKNYSEGFCTFSESLRHDPVAILAHLKLVIDHALKKNPGIKRIHFQSDGPSTQYRNKTMFYLICKLFPKMYENFESIIYNYSEAGHGKGPADGIGAVVKRTLDSLVAHGSDIGNYESLVTAVRENCQNIFSGTVTQTDIDLLEPNLSKNIKVFSGTMKVHQFKWYRADENLIRFNEMSCYDCSITDKCQHYHLGELKLQAATEKSVVKPGNRIKRKQPERKKNQNISKKVNKKP